MKPFAISAYEKTSPPGYQLVRDDGDVVLFRGTEGSNRDNYIIAHRGTWVSRDARTDALLALGIYDKPFRSRLQSTRDMVEFAKRTNPDATIQLTGHSLGGTSVNYAVRNDDYIRENIAGAVVYNMGSTPLRPERLAEGVQHYHVSGDPVSFTAETTQTIQKPSSFAAKAAGFFGGGIPAMLVVGLLSHTVNHFE